MQDLDQANGYLPDRNLSNHEKTLIIGKSQDVFVGCVSSKSFLGLIMKRYFSLKRAGTGDFVAQNACMCYSSMISSSLNEGEHNIIWTVING